MVKREAGSAHWLPDTGNIIGFAALAVVISFVPFEKAARDISVAQLVPRYL